MLYGILSVVMFAVISLVVSLRLKMVWLIMVVESYFRADQKKKSFACRMFFFLPLFDFTLMNVYMDTRIK